MWDLYHRDVVYCVSVCDCICVACCRCRCRQGIGPSNCFFLSFFSLGVRAGAACCVSKKFDLNFEFQQ